MSPFSARVPGSMDDEPLDAVVKFKSGAHEVSISGTGVNVILSIDGKDFPFGRDDFRAFLGACSRVSAIVSPYKFDLAGGGLGLTPEMLEDAKKFAREMQKGIDPDGDAPWKKSLEEPPKE